MKILVTGGTGFIGAPLVQVLKNDGHDVVVVRRTDADLVREPLRAEFSRGVEAVIHLLGENLSQGRWTLARKRELWNSRVNSSRNLLASFESPPKIILSASAIGYYGDRQDEELTEVSKKGDGFLSDLCAAWEEPFLEKQKEWSETRFAQMRKGVVLASQGGAFEKMLMPYKLFLGGRLGPGNQWMSWVMLEDVVEVYRQALSDHRYQGPLNVVSREPLMQRNFAREINENLGRPMGPPVPAFVLKTVLGEMSEVLLASQLVLPARLTEWEFHYQYPGIAQALQKLIPHR